MRSCIIMHGTTKLGQFFTDKVPSQTTTLTVRDIELDGNTLRFQVSERMKLLRILRALQKGDEVVWKDYEKMIRGTVEGVEITEDEEDDSLFVKVVLKDCKVQWL